MKRHGESVAQLLAGSTVLGIWTLAIPTARYEAAPGLGSQVLVGFRVRVRQGFGIEKGSPLENWRYPVFRNSPHRAAPFFFFQDLCT